MATGNRNYYDVLGVPHNSSIEEVRAVFRRLALQHHPDRNKSAGATARFREILAAYQALSDPERKANYDRLDREQAEQRARYAEWQRQQAAAAQPELWAHRIWRKIGSAIGVIGWFVGTFFLGVFVIAQFDNIVGFISEQVRDESAFGPVSGTLDHEDDGFIPGLDSRTNLADSVVEATFIDTHSAAGRDWSNGFLIRRDLRQYHIVVISNSGNWFHRLRDGVAESSQSIQSGPSSSIKTGSNVENHVRVVALADRGWLFINGVYEAELDLSGISEAGSVSVVGAWFRGDEHPGHTTRFSDFTVRSLQRSHGPVYGAIESAPGSATGTYDSQTSLADGIFEISFLNTYSDTRDPWISGLLFRYSGSDRYHGVTIDGTGAWRHGLAAGGAFAIQTPMKSPAETGTIKQSGVNHIRVIAIGGEGWLFINGEYVDKLDLGGWLGAGRALAVGSDFEVPRVSGNFSDFTVWSVAGAP